MPKVNKTFANIVADLKKFGRKIAPSKIKKVIASSYSIIPNLGSNSLVFKGQVNGDSNPLYNVKMVFFKIKFSDKPSKIFNQSALLTTLEGRKRKRVYYTTPSLSKNPVMVRSDDSDFRFRFMKELAMKNSLWPGSNSWIRYDAKKEASKGKVKSKKRGKKKGKTVKKVYYQVTHPQGGTYTRATPHPDEGGREFMNPKGLMGYSYPIKNFRDFLLKKEVIKY